MNEESLSSQQGEILQISPDGDSFKDFVTNLNAPGFLAFRRCSRTRNRLYSCRWVGIRTAPAENAPGIPSVSRAIRGLRQRVFGEGGLAPEHSQVTPKRSLAPRESGQLVYLVSQ